MQCIGEAFGVDAADEAQKELYSTKPANLLSIFDVYLNTKKSAKVSKVRSNTVWLHIWRVLPSHLLLLLLLLLPKLRVSFVLVLWLFV